jgi:quinol monooxygenase YgiN
MADPSYLVIARVHGVAARRDELRGAAEDLARVSGAEGGCLSFEVLSVSADPSELVLVSAWRTEQDMRAHFRSGAYGRYVVAVTDLLTRPSDVAIHRVAETVHPVGDLSLEPGRQS